MIRGTNTHNTGYKYNQNQKRGSSSLFTWPVRGSRSRDCILRGSHRSIASLMLPLRQWASPRPGVAGRCIGHAVASPLVDDGLADVDAISAEYSQITCKAHPSRRAFRACVLIVCAHVCTLILCACARLGEVPACLSCSSPCKCIIASEGILRATLGGPVESAWHGMARTPRHVSHVPQVTRRHVPLVMCAHEGGVICLVPAELTVSFPRTYSVYFAPSPSERQTSGHICAAHSLEGTKGLPSLVVQSKRSQTAPRQPG